MALPGEIRVVPHVPAAFAELLATEAPRSVALSGGATARACYTLCATAARLDWSQVEVYFGDERWVPVHDRDSNEGMARVAFLDEVGPAWIHSTYHAGTTPEAAAAAYDLLVAGADPIDLVHLGLGPDGHTASLFPGSPARLVVVTVAGADKRDALARIRAGEDLPASRIEADRVLWLVDPAAFA
jgi:6-phosphogluconolactonase